MVESQWMYPGNPVFSREHNVNCHSGNEQYAHPQIPLAQNNEQSHQCI